MKTALVCGAGGFIGGHLTRRLKAEGYWVRGVDVNVHDYNKNDVDEFVVCDLRNIDHCFDVTSLTIGVFDEVYQLAADFGGMGYIDNHPIECMTNNVTINLNMLKAISELGCGKYFFSSSVCVYRNMEVGEPPILERDAYPAMPDNEYGWEKLYSERLALAYARQYKFDARIARFNNCYGPYSGWYGGREKAPAALCRKVAEAPDGDMIEVWGDGSAVRNYIYIDDLIDAVRVLMDSGDNRPTNIGTDEYVTVDELARAAIVASGKQLGIKHVAGNVGVESRNFSNRRIYSLGYYPRHAIDDGIPKLYEWISQQVKAQ